jgi:hypothetical protein
MDKNTPEQLGPEIPIKTKEIPMGLPGINRRMVQGFVLTNDVVLLDSERDPQGRYYGGAGMDGMYLRTPHIFTPVRDATGEIRAFREVLSKPYKSRKRGEPER